jgi:hypothetical protein
MNLAVPSPHGEVTPGSRPLTFSVVIPAYQVAECVGGAIASALAQTLPPQEVVVVDDASTDDLASALAPFEGRITQVRHDLNAGEAAAKNSGIRAARSEFVAILDADDIFLPERLAALSALALQRPDLDVLTTDAYLEVDGRVLRRVYTPDWSFVTDDQRRAILSRNFIFGHVAVRREAMLRAGGFDESIRRTTDWECWIRMILNGAQVGAVLEPLAHYRVRRSSLSASRGLMLVGSLQTMHKALAHPRLQADERMVAEATVQRLRRELANVTLAEGLRARAPHIRRRAARIAFAPALPARTRLKAMLAVIAPRLVESFVSRRQGQRWVGAGGTTVHRG